MGCGGVDRDVDGDRRTCEEAANENPRDQSGLHGELVLW